ncbi:MAG: hypothetical protein B5M53_07695, partial [Candidatus Cloacimonas sp. 4484_209]
CYNNLKINDKAAKYSATLKNLQPLTHGPFPFEDGGSLDAVSFSSKAQKRNSIQIELFVHPPSTFHGCTAFLSFYKNGSFYFGKDLNLTNFKPLGELYAYTGKISIPRSIPSGTYDVFFTFRIPKIDYRYHLWEKGTLTQETKISIGKFCFLRS